jgi:hypothetical protein
MQQLIVQVSMRSAAPVDFASVSLVLSNIMGTVLVSCILYIGFPIKFRVWGPKKHFFEYR